MNKTTKIWLAVASFLAVLGIVIFVGIMAVYNWDFSKLGTVKYETNTYTANGTFDKISINVDTTEIKFLPTDSKDCSIVCFENEKIKHSAKIQNGTLVIDTVDTRKWYDFISISLGSPKMTVYLPQNEYNSLSVETDTGDITLPKDFSFKNIEIDGDTSDVSCFASVSDIIEIELSTGDINIDTVTTGKLDLSTSTGDITLKNVISTDSLSIETDTGDVEFKDSDADKIYVETSTGDVTGTLLSEKVFITQSNTGRIRVPKTTTGGKCEIETDTGDIKITIN